VSGGPYVGIALLSDDAVRQFTGIVNDGTSGPFNVYDGMTAAEHYQALSSGITGTHLPATGRADVSLTAGFGPITLAAGQTKRLGYAVCVGYSLLDITVAAQQAYTRYQALITANKGKLASSIQLYPNPAQTHLMVSGAVAGTLSVVDLLGAEQKVLVTATATGAELDVHTLTPGVYFVRMATKQGTVVRRFVKE
jgi:hypothetical protein